MNCMRNANIADPNQSHLTHLPGPITWNRRVLTAGITMAAAFLFKLMTTTMMLGSFLTVGGLSSLHSMIPSVELEPREEPCPPCELLFRKLEKNKKTGKLTQVVRVQERGEPKSGTSLMLDWATGALDQACIYLQRLYGEATCLSFQALRG